MAVLNLSLSLFPAQSSVLGKGGMITNQYYFYLKRMADILTAINNGGPYVPAGGSVSSIKSGLYADMGAGTAGEIYFTTDTGQIFINEGGIWHQEVPAFSGDATSPIGSPVLTLANVNPVTYGTFTNISSMTVNEKGLVTYIASGPSSALSVGTPGTIQFAAPFGAFDGDPTNLFYTAVSGTPTLQLGQSSSGILALGLGGVTIEGDASGNLTSTAIATNTIVGPTEIVLQTGSSSIGLIVNASGALGIGLSATSYGTTGQVLTSQSSTSPPIWEDIPEPNLPATFVGFGSVSNQLTGNSSLTYDGIGQLIIGSTGGFAGLQAAPSNTLYLSSSTETNYVFIDDTNGFQVYNPVSNFIIDTTGAWNLGSSPGTSGQVLTTQGAGSPPIWAAGGGGSPGGTNGQLQYNESGVFGGTDFFYYNPTTLIMEAGSATNTGPVIEMDPNASFEIRGNPYSVIPNLSGTLFFFGGNVGPLPSSAGFGSQVSFYSGRGGTLSNGKRGGNIFLYGGSSFDLNTGDGHTATGGNVTITGGQSVHIDGSDSGQGGNVTITGGPALTSVPVTWTIGGGSGYTDGTYTDPEGNGWFIFSGGTTTLQAFSVTFAGGVLASFIPYYFDNTTSGSTIGDMCTLAITMPGFPGGGSGAQITVDSVASSASGGIIIEVENDSEIELFGPINPGGAGQGTSGQVLTSQGPGASTTWGPGGTPTAITPSIGFGYGGPIEFFSGGTTSYDGEINYQFGGGNFNEVYLGQSQLAQGWIFIAQPSAPGTPGNGDGQLIEWVAGSAYTGSNLNGGDLVLSSGAKDGSGNDGDIRFYTGGEAVFGAPTHQLTLSNSGQWLVGSSGSGTIGQVLTSQGSGAQPQWTTPTTGTVTSVSGTSGEISSTGGATPVLALVSTAVTPGSYTLADITVDSFGRITAASSGSIGSYVSSFNTRTGAVILTSGDVTTALGFTPGTITYVAASSTTLSISGSPITSSGTLVIDLNTTAVTAGTYTNTNLTVDAYGRITAASDGTIAAGGSSGELQWNNSGSLDGLPTSTWDGTNLTLAGNNESTTNGGDVSVLGGTNASGGNGGNVIIQSGSGDNYNGYIAISTGGALSPNPGDVQILAAGTGNLSLTTYNTMQVDIASNTGLSGEFLGSDGAGNVVWSTPPAPTLTATYIGYGDGSNLLTGSNDFTFLESSTSPIVVLGNTTTISFGFAAANVSAGNPGIAVTISAGSTTDSQTGGLLTLTGGSSTSGTGGGIQIEGGSGVNGGSFSLFGGTATTGNGGSFTLAGGASSSGFGGSAELIGGNGPLGTGDVTIIGQEIFIETALATQLHIQNTGEWNVGTSGPGSAGQVLASQGTGNPPTWNTPIPVLTGRATLVGGTVTVSTSSVLSTSNIFLTTVLLGGTIGIQYISAIVNGTSFTITSTSPLDTSTVSWMITT